MRSWGGGHFGITYKARHTLDGGICALKVIRLRQVHANMEGAMGRRMTPEKLKGYVVKEATNLKLVAHPSIVSYTTVFEELYVGEPVVGIVMEFVDGGTLEAAVSDAIPELYVGDKPREAEVRRILRELLGALAYLHDGTAAHGGMIHRDLKGDNVFLTAGDRHVKVGDLGLAAVVNGGAYVQRAMGDGRGHLTYRSPEEYRGEDYDGRADVWAVGMMLLEMLTQTIMSELFDRSTVPFALEKPSAIEDIMEEAAGCELEGAMRAMLCQDPAGRPTAAAALAMVGGGAADGEEAKGVDVGGRGGVLGVAAKAAALAPPDVVISAEVRAEAAKLLAENKKDSDGDGPLNCAACEGKLELCIAMIEAGAKVDDPSDNGSTALYLASQTGHDKVVSVLLTGGADINKARNDGTTPLYAASCSGHDKVVSVLVTGGADINKAANDSYGATPLFVASQSGHDKVVSVLLTAGADINKAAHDGATPLYLASQNGHDKVVSMLVTRGADINKAAHDGCTPLWIASQNGHDKVVSVLVTGGADINKANNKDATPLCTASEYGHDKVVSVLVTGGADINKTMPNGTTPLFFASYKGHDKVVTILLTGGADINQKAWQGHTALWAAQDQKHDAIVALLKSKGAR